MLRELRGIIFLVCGHNKMNHLEVNFVKKLFKASK